MRRHVRIQALWWWLDLAVPRQHIRASLRMLMRRMGRHLLQPWPCRYWAASQARALCPWRNAQVSRRRWGSRWPWAFDLPRHPSHCLTSYLNLRNLPPHSPAALPPPPPALSPGRCDDAEVAEQQAALNLLHRLESLDVSLLLRQCHPPPSPSSLPSEGLCFSHVPGGSAEGDVVEQTDVLDGGRSLLGKVEILVQGNVLLGKARDGAVAKVYYSLWAEASEQPQGGGVVSEQPEGRVSSEQLGGGANGQPSDDCGEGVLLGEGILSFRCGTYPSCMNVWPSAFPNAVDDVR